VENFHHKINKEIHFQTGETERKTKQKWDEVFVVPEKREV